MNNIKIAPYELIALKKEKPLIILDVRNPDEFEVCHVPGSINLPLDKIEKGQTSLLQKDQTIYLLCQGGMRSQRAFQVLQSQGFADLVCVDGGIAACEKIAGAVIRVSSRIPLMRQVQIGAGFLVLMGVVLSKIISPHFIYLSGFVGVGLIVAGATGFCGMALVLEKMPWNQIRADCCVSKNEGCK